MMKTAMNLTALLLLTSLGLTPRSSGQNIVQNSSGGNIPGSLIATINSAPDGGTVRFASTLDGATIQLDQPRQAISLGMDFRGHVGSRIGAELTLNQLFRHASAPFQVEPGPNRMLSRQTPNRSGSLPA